MSPLQIDKETREAVQGSPAERVYRSSSRGRLPQGNGERGSQKWHMCRFCNSNSIGLPRGQRIGRRSVRRTFGECYGWMDGWMGAWMHACMHCLGILEGRTIVAPTLGLHSLWSARNFGRNFPKFSRAFCKRGGTPAFDRHIALRLGLLGRWVLARSLITQCFYTKKSTARRCSRLTCVISSIIELESGFCFRRRVSTRC